MAAPVCMSDSNRVCADKTRFWNCICKGGKLQAKTAGLGSGCKMIVFCSNMCLAYNTTLL